MRNQRKKIDPKFIKRHAAAIVAAAIAALWILLELALFFVSIPNAPEMTGADYCLVEDHNHAFSSPDYLFFSYRCGEINSISFNSKTLDPSLEPDKPVTVKVMAYEKKDSETLITYRTEQFCVGERTDIIVDIPEEAGQVLLWFGHEGFDYSVRGVTFNSPDVGSFNFLRTGVVIAVIIVCWLCYHFRLWSVFFDASNKNHRMAGIALCIFCVAVAILLSALVNTEREKVEYPLQWDAVYYNPYEQQFDALLKGQLHLDIEPSKELLELEDPYDPAQREGVEYSWDRAFYNGKYYSYFGMGPILAVYYPYYMLTDDMPSENTISTIFAVMTALFFSLAAVKWASMYTKKLPLPLLFIGVISGLFSSQIFLVMRGRSRFYYIATIAGMAFLSLFLWLLLCGISGSVRFGNHPEASRRQKLLLYALAGTAYGFLFISRVNMALLAAFVVVPALVFNIITEKGEDGKRRLRRIGHISTELLAIGIPVVAFIVFQFVLNYRRFDNIFEFGSSYQLTVSDISKYRFRLSDLPNAVYHYFFQPLSWSADFPFVSLDYSYIGNYGHYVYVDTGMGMFSIPMMLMLFGSVLIFINKKRSPAYKITLGSVLVGTVAVALFDFCFGGVIFRYTCDLTLLGAFAAAVIIFSLCDDVTEQTGDAWAVKSCTVAFTAICIISLLVSLVLAMSLNGNLTSYSPGAYVAFRKLFLWF